MFVFKCGHFTPTDLPYAFVLGKRLKKWPEDYMRNEVQRDYRLWTERTQMGS